MSRPTHVVVLTRSFCFPHGLASAERARLVGRALAEGGAHVLVLCTRAVDRSPAFGNTAVSGVVDGVAFEHTCGRTVRAEGFVARRASELRGAAVALWRLRRLRRRGEADVVYFWWGELHWQPAPAFYRRCLAALGIPVVLELNELPWTLLPDRSLPDRLFRQLAGCAGVLAISPPLAEWASRSSRQLGGRVAVHELSILVDVSEQTVQEYPDGAPTVLLAASMAYERLVRLALSAMDSVWQEQPACRLVLTGVDEREPRARWLLELAAAGGLDERVHLKGFVARDELLALYSSAHALLMPLEDDAIARYRAPTKIGEYLASGRPVVMSSVGQLGGIFTDGETAFLAPAGSPKGFAAAICRALQDPARADAVGRSGRELAAQRFHYARHAEPLCAFFAQVAAAAGSERSWG